jgi:hypothetical protein
MVYHDSGKEDLVYLLKYIFFSCIRVEEELHTAGLAHGLLMGLRETTITVDHVT